MSYIPKNWKDGEVIYHQDLNRIEHGIQTALSGEAKVLFVETNPTTGFPNIINPVSDVIYACLKLPQEQTSINSLYKFFTYKGVWQNISQGPKGDGNFTFIKYSESQPASDLDIHDVFSPSTDKYIGFYNGTSNVAPSDYTEYTWCRFIGTSPVVTIEQIQGGIRVTIIDEANPNGQSFTILNGVNAVNPFKGWFTTANIPTTGQEGDYCNVTDTQTQTVTIYRWNTTQNKFVDTGEVPDTATGETFASGETLQQVALDNSHLVNPVNTANPTQPVLAQAEDVMQLKAKLDGVTAEETKVQLFESGEGQNVYNGYINGSTGEYTQSIYNKFIVVPLNGAKSVRWLVKENASNPSYLGWAFGTFGGEIDSTLSTFTALSKGVYANNPLDNQAVEYVKNAPEGATHAVITIWIYKSGGDSAVTMDNFYCYLQTGKTVLQEIVGIDNPVLGQQNNLSVNNKYLMAAPTSTQSETVLDVFSGDLLSARRLSGDVVLNSRGKRWLVHPNAYNSYYMIFKKDISSTMFPLTLQALVEGGYLSDAHKVGSGWTSALKINGGVDTYIDIPDDAVVIVFAGYIISNTTTYRLPSWYKIEEIEHIDGIVDERIKEATNSLQSEIENIGNGYDLLYQLADPSNAYTGKSGGSSNTTVIIDGGLIISANNTYENYVGFKRSALSSLMSRFSTNPIDIRLVFKVTGDSEDLEEHFTYSNIQSYISGYSADTIVAINKQLNNGYVILDSKITFNNATTSGQDYIIFKTTGSTNPVTVMLVGVYYKLNDNISDNFGDTVYLGSLTHGIKELISKVASDIISGKVTIINVSRDGTSRTGRHIDFYGEDAIKQALESITDASPSNRYVLHIEGKFYITDPQSTALMMRGGEYSIIAAKNYVDIEGDGSEYSQIIMDFPANANFHTGKTYSDYQPLYLYGVGCKVSGLGIIGNNCRYAVHIETNNSTEAHNKTIEFDNCDVEYQGHTGYPSGSYGDCFGTGIEGGQVWNIRNTTMRSLVIGAAFAMHSPLHKFSNPCFVNFENCQFEGSISLHNYQYDNNVFVSYVGCTFGVGGSPVLSYPIYHVNNSTEGFHIAILTRGDIECLYKMSGYSRGAVLKVSSSLEGVNSTVRFNNTCTAFAFIIGDGNNIGANKTIYGWDTNYGYVWRDGGANLQGQAFGAINIDEDENRSLGKLLGDCSVTSKELVIIINGTNYTVVFNEDFSNQDNSYVLSKINEVLGENGTASVFYPSRLYYPKINGLQVVKCYDSNSIKKGMGVVYLTQNRVRRAKNTDGYIDGIALDDMANGQFGRIITSGYVSPNAYNIANYSESEVAYFTTIDDYPSNVFNDNDLGSCGIDTANDGIFKYGQTPYVLRKVPYGKNLAFCWRILGN